MTKQNAAADHWARSQDKARKLADHLKVGDVVSYETADEIGECVWAELRKVLSDRALVIVDEGNGYEIRSE